MSIKVSDVDEDQIGIIREAIGTFKIEDKICAEGQNSIKRLMHIECYSG